MQGFMLDSARTLECRSYYPRFIDFMAARGCDTLWWHFTDDQGCSLRFDSLPEAASPNAYRKDEMRSLIAHAWRQGVRVIPELASLGHTRYITRARPDLAELSENDEAFTSLCPVHPRTREVLSGLLDEVAELFDDEIVHVGMDEVNFGGHPLTREALKTRSAGELFADHVHFLHGHLANRGRRMMMWGDRLLKDESVARSIPKDILVANWQYTPVVPEATTTQLRGMGFDVVSCSAMISHDQPLYPGQQFSLDNLRDTPRHAREHETRGMMTTVWTPQRFLADALWPAVHYAAGLKEDASLSIDDSMRRFAEDFHGFTPGTAWLQAVRMVFKHSPMRKPWVAALRLEFDERLDGVDLDAQAVCWRESYVALREQAFSVEREVPSYNAFLLMVELSAHVWERAAAVARGETNDEPLATSERLAEALDAAWDRERFADDPRKYEPVFPFDRDDHLLQAFAHGTGVLRSAHSAVVNTRELH